MERKKLCKVRNTRKLVETASEVIVSVVLLVVLAMLISLAIKKPTYTSLDECPNLGRRYLVVAEALLLLNNDTIVVSGNTGFSIYINDTLACSKCPSGTEIRLNGSVVHVVVTDGRRSYYTIKFDEKRRRYYIAEAKPAAVVCFIDVSNT